MGTTVDKLEKLLDTKNGIKKAINGSGNTVGDKFSDYPVAITNGMSGIAAAITEKGVQTASDAPFDVLQTNVREIETGPKSANISMDFYGNVDGKYITYIGEDQKLMENIPLSSVSYSINVINPSFIYFSMSNTNSMRISGNIKRMTGISNSLFFVSGHCSISYEG